MHTVHHMCVKLHEGTIVLHVVAHILHVHIYICCTVERGILFIGADFSCSSRVVSRVLLLLYK